MTTIYILLEVQPTKKLPKDVTDLITDRIYRMDWVSKQAPCTATILSANDVVKVLLTKEYE